MRTRYTCLSCILQQSRQASPLLSTTLRSATSFTHSPLRWRLTTEPSNERYGQFLAIAGKRCFSSTSPRAIPRAKRQVDMSKIPLRSKKHIVFDVSTGQRLKVAESLPSMYYALALLRSEMNFFVNNSKEIREVTKGNDFAHILAHAEQVVRHDAYDDRFKDISRQVAAVLARICAGQDYSTATKSIEKIRRWQASSSSDKCSMLNDDPDLKDSLLELGFVHHSDEPVSLPPGQKTPKPSKPPTPHKPPKTSNSDINQGPRNVALPVSTPPHSGSETSRIANGEATPDAKPVPTKSVTGEDEAQVPASTFKSLGAAGQMLAPVSTGDIAVPKLSFDLSRVLFNPGVYQLQDPRSRVYNFDPYLEKIMPITEFNFEALNKYITSSEDNSLRELALQKGKRYVGSSSSMTSALAHFHFLLSTWRPINVETLSRAFQAESDNFTKFQRAPTAAFLRYQDGVYAMDADKEFDDATVLLSLGRSMEKLLTLEKSDYEKLRKSNAIETGNFDVAPEQYHYSELGSFMMRSQLDAHDPRLPGTGMFDLKTRAVVAVRMTMADQRGTGYQIKHRYGTWESFEREYYDMMRSAFLKYSLQVRMGRMDGVFVAYHNIDRIFGFQYISLAEMDRALHGQVDTALGDQEFTYSVKLLSEVFDRATTHFPNQSIRFHFETRESAATKSDAKPWMYVFAEPVSEEEVERIQTSRLKEVKEAEERILSGMARAPRQAPPARAKPESNAGDTDFLNSLGDLEITEPKPKPKPEPPAKVRVLGMKVVVQHRVDGRKVTRPVDLDSQSEWELEYSITEMPDAQAQGKYNQCKARRSIMFSAARDENHTAERYISRLIDMSDAGAAWRKDMDEKDAARERVVLYNEDV